MQHPDSAPQRDEATHTAARAILEALVRRGVDVAFGIPGGLISPIFDALSDVARMRWIATRHEAIAGFAAMGHTIASGRPAMVLTTGGPGVTNAITAVASAFVEEIPMIVLAGDVPTTSTSRAALHDTSIGGLDGMALMRTVTRFAARIDSAQGAAGIVEQALRAATGPRPGPVYLSVPLDVSSAVAHDTHFALSDPPPGPIPNDRAVAEVAGALRRARRPLLVVGNGARGAAPALLSLAERLACPVVTTPHGKGIFPDAHPLHLGGIGFGGHPSAMDYLKSRPDVTLIVGSRLGDIATNGWRVPLAGTSATFQIDREAYLMGRNCPLTFGLVSDARLALEAILTHLPSDVARPVRQVHPRRYLFDAEAASDALPLAPGRVMRALEAAFPNAMWCVDVGEHAAYAVHYLSIDSPQRFRTLMGLASMGSGFGMAIGAKDALPDAPVIGLCGDGCFSMYAGEVLTLAESSIGLILAVMNDGRWNMVDKGMETIFGRKPYAMPSTVADIAGVANDFGAIGVRIERQEDLDATWLRSLPAPGRPVVLDIRFDPSHTFSVASRAATITRIVEGALR
jgi:acetolactate synthase-1/2/3 large subunit